MPPSHSANEVTAYYSSALAALRYLEHVRPTGRRFGADADARWSSFRGDLTTADRIDLLIRDADAQWPEAFGARAVFAKRAVAEDEPFGADWISLDPVDAEELWRATLKLDAPGHPAEVLRSVAAAWGHHLVDVGLDSIAATDKIVAAGPSAILALLEAFGTSADVDWSAQMIVVATPPAHRQLAALAGALLGITKATRIVAADSTQKAVASARLVTSADAAPEDAARARELASA
jgi:hypothetical protein